MCTVVHQKPSLETWYIKQNFLIIQTIFQKRSNFLLENYIFFNFCWKIYYPQLFSDKQENFFYFTPLNNCVSPSHILTLLIRFSFFVFRKSYRKILIGNKLHFWISTVFLKKIHTYFKKKLKRQTLINCFVQNVPCAWESWYNSF